MRESVVRAQRAGLEFGAKPARSEAPDRVASERRPSGRGSSGKKMPDENYFTMSRTGGMGVKLMPFLKSKRRFRLS